MCSSDLADPAGFVGEAKRKPHTLMTLVMYSLLKHHAKAKGLQQGLHLYGHDYDTPDGTTVRDYVHPTDLAKAHLEALPTVGTVDVARVAATAVISAEVYGDKLKSFAGEGGGVSDPALREWVKVLLRIIVPGVENESILTKLPLRTSVDTGSEQSTRHMSVGSNPT